MEQPPPKRFCKFIKASFPWNGWDVLIDAVIFWTEGHDGTIHLGKIEVTSADLNGNKLNDLEFEIFRIMFEPDNVEDLTWIALSSIDSSETSAC